MVTRNKRRFMPNPVFLRIKENSDWFSKAGKPLDPPIKVQNNINIAKSILKFGEVVRTSNPGNALTNVVNEFGLYQATEIAMILCGIGSTPLQNLWLYISEKNSVEPFSLTGKIPFQNTITFNYKYSFTGFGKGTVNTNLSHEGISKLNANILIDVLNILFFAYATEELGYFTTWRRCRLSEYCGLTAIDVQDLIILSLVEAHAQIAGRVNVNTGSIAEARVRTVIEKIKSNNPQFVSIVSTKRVPEMMLRGEGAKSFDFVIKLSNPEKPHIPDKYIAFEVAWQETANSVIHRKDSECEEFTRKFTDKNHLICYVVDGVGYFARAQALNSITQNAHFACGLSDKELSLLENFLQQTIDAYKTL